MGATMRQETIRYVNRPESRLLDLRPDGIGCIPGIGFSAFKSVHRDPELHCHPGAMEICFCLKGNLTFKTDRTEYAFLPGHIFVSSPSQPHCLKNNPRGLKLYWLLFRIAPAGTAFLGLDRSESEWLSHALVNLPKRVFAGTPRVRRAFATIFDLYDHAHPSPARRTRMKAAALELLISIVDAAQRPPCKIPSKIAAIAKRIRDCPESDYRIADMAKEAGLSVSAFSDIFKRSMGLPMHAYLINQRILRAKKLLENTDRDIASIAAEMRFRSKPHFAITFRQIVGMTPHALRQARKG